MGATAERGKQREGERRGTGKRDEEVADDEEEEVTEREARGEVQI